MITPAARGSRAGNRATAERWQRLLENAGHRVEVVADYQGESCDLFIALHAWRSREAVARFRELWPNIPLIVVLTGTDIYRHQIEVPEPTLATMDAADALIGLHDRVAEDIPARFRARLVTLYQSAIAPPPAPQHSIDHFRVSVIGHLREEKDSLRAARAARLLPEESRVRVIAAGKAHNAEWQQMAEQETAENPRFQWLGQLDEQGTRELLTGSRVMVISSVMEGGANVVSEACRAGVPVLASDIPGNRGLLGDDYPGYFPVRDEHALATLIHKAETDPEFLQDLESRVARLAARFTPDREQASLEQALALACQRCSERVGTG
ncbi:selenoneine biosynthesis selenosugar synthase SenB [Marinobacter pelagius]|uniref:Putative glycosyltransferase, TIGR04348 family n=1 Tax=Marinobacter pelagius TaxID=379482 RepID=A0A1I4ZIH0_9GAMM|nr:selenoneine biosynthesis selenosugar synthase SenB [Marinobacter pelagius]SFN49710.1 putative glycosyltransferase, TIGR04348 family [Marinobacter pelagius]